MISGVTTCDTQTHLSPLQSVPWKPFHSQDVVETVEGENLLLIKTINQSNDEAGIINQSDDKDGIQRTQHGTREIPLQVRRGKGKLYERFLYKTRLYNEGMRAAGCLGLPARLTRPCTWRNHSMGPKDPS